MGRGIDSYIKEQFGIAEVDIRTYSPLTLAYIGDGIYDLVIRSVVVGKGVSNGVFAFAIFLWIMITIYRIGLKGLSRRSPYNAYLLWTIISSFQLLLFGPPAILKNNSSIAFAVMIALFYFNYLHNLRRIVKKKNMQIPKKQITKTHLYHILSKNEQI